MKTRIVKIALIVVFATVTVWLVHDSVSSLDGFEGRLVSIMDCFGPAEATVFPSRNPDAIFRKLRYASGISSNEIRRLFGPPVAIRRITSHHTIEVQTELGLTAESVFSEDLDTTIWEYSIPVFPENDDVHYRRRSVVFDENGRSIDMLSGYECWRMFPRRRATVPKATNGFAKTNESIIDPLSIGSDRRQGYTVTTNSLESDFLSADFSGKEILRPEYSTNILAIPVAFTVESSERHSFSPSQASDINNAMDRELEADEIAEDFGARMEGLFRDKGADEMVRNFAVQHLERLAQERTVRGTWDVDSEEAEKVRAALEDAALEVDNSIGGTAMLALARLSEIDPHVDLRRLSSRSSSLVANPSARLSTRIAAAQVCGLLHVRSALPSLRSLVFDPATPTPLRLSADRAVTEIESR